MHVYRARAYRLKRRSFDYRFAAAACLDLVSHEIVVRYRRDVQTEIRAVYRLFIYQIVYRRALVY